MLNWFKEKQVKPATELETEALTPNVGAFKEVINYDALDAEAAEAILQGASGKKPYEEPCAEEPALTDEQDEGLSALFPANVAEEPVVPKAYIEESEETATEEDPLPVSHARLSGSVFTVEEEAPATRHPLVGSLMAPVTFAIKGNRCQLGGVWLEELAKTYGTPLYIMDGATLRQATQAYKQTLQGSYPGQHLAVFACKANLTMGLCKLLEAEGFGLDVVSAGELHTALKANFPPERIIMNGNNKTAAELAMALQAGINRLVVDNASELELLASEARRLDVKANVLLRVAPGIECHTHDYIKTGQNDSKFGFPLEQLGEAIDAIQTTYSDAITLKGLQAHVGSQIFELTAYQDLVKILLNIMYNVRQEYGLELEDLDVGGGLGIAYTTADTPEPIETLVHIVSQTVVKYAQKLGLTLPRLMMEPGRSLVARAGVTLYTVGSRKDLEGYPSFVAVDGGMGDNIRPALYQAEYTAIVANKPLAANEETVRLVGKYCESGDVLLKAFNAPRLERGDLVLVFGTGAYNYSMSSTYNRFAPPAMVLVEEGKSAVLVKRSTLDELVANDRLPDWLL
jgi:diaminopimelate decarboxylase